MAQPRTFTGSWVGKVSDGAEAEHDAFVDWLRSSDGGNLLRKCSLTEYALYQQGPDLEVVFRAARPVLIAGFLRNKRLWPRFWEFEHPGDDDAGAEKPLVLHWVRD